MEKSLKAKSDSVLARFADYIDGTNSGIPRYSSVDAYLTDPNRWADFELTNWHFDTVALKFKYVDLP